MGYVYQIRLALVLLLERANGDLAVRVRVEVLDDVSLELDGSPVTLVQAKHHNPNASPLTESSEDFWRTVGGWLDSEWSTKENTEKVLITTVGIAGTGLSLLGEGSRDPEQAQIYIDTAAEASTNRATKSWREKWLALSDATRRAILQSTWILGQSGGLDDLDTRLARSLGYAAPVDDPKAFFERIWSRWQHVVVTLLKGQANEGVNGYDVRKLVSAVRDEFSTSALTISIPQPTGQFADSLVEKHLESLFVHQMRWVTVPPRVMELAILDFYRATAQAADWSEGQLLGLQELQEFTTRLRTEWDVAFSWSISKAGDDLGEDEVAALGRELFMQVISNATALIREEVTDPFFTRGTFHELANAGDVGWHRDFKNKIATMVGVAVEVE